MSHYDQPMAVVLHPWQIFVAAMAGWFTRQQGAVIEYLLGENRVLKAIERRALAKVVDLSVGERQR